MLKTKI